MAWLGGLDQPFEPGPPPDASRVSVRAWNMLGGKIDWSGLELVAELLGVHDIESLVADLMLIRDHKEIED